MNEYDNYYEDETNIGITHTGNLRTIGKTKRPDTFAAQMGFEPEEIDQVTLLEPGGDTLLYDQPETYNPYRYAYRLLIEEYNIELMVKFMLISENPEERAPINFTDPKTGNTYEIPFFLTPQEGKTDPAENYTAYTDPNTNRNMFYKDGEKTLWTIPIVVRAKNLGGVGSDGIERDPVLLTKEAIADPNSPCYINPERLQIALETFRDEVEQDPKAPRALKTVLKEALGYNGFTDIMSAEYQSHDDAYDNEYEDDEDYEENPYEDDYDYPDDEDYPDTW